MRFSRGPAWLAGILMCAVFALVGVGAVNAAAPPSLDSLAANPVTKAAQDRAVEAGRRAQQALSAPGAAQEREDSADEFAGLSASGALSTFTDAFKKVADAPAYSTDGLLAEGQGVITQVLSEKEARVALPGGHKGILLSGLPLQVPADGGGGKENVDAALVSENGEFVPDAPLADYSVSKDLGEGVDLEDADVTIAPVGSGVDDARPQRVGDSVFWANTSRDTDFVVTPLVNGVETFHQVRSEDAPESFPLNVTVPDGGQIVRSAQMPGGLEVKDADGNVVTTISPAIAHDADGTDVPATFTINDDQSRITINVPHRDRDVHYPVLVDPTVTMYQLHDDDGASNGLYPGWVWIGNQGVEHLAGQGYLGWGTYTWLPANRSYNINDGGFWYFPAPGDSTIKDARLRSTYYTQGRHSCIWQGITKYGGGWENGMTALTNGTDLSGMPYVRCADGVNNPYLNQTRGITNSDKTAGSALLMAIIAYRSSNPGWIPATPDVDIAYLAASDVTIQDDKAPTITETHNQNSVTFHINDTGTGVKWALAEKGGGWSQNYTFDCGHSEIYPMYGCTKSRDIAVPGLAVGDPVKLSTTDAVNNDGAIFWDTFYPTSWTYGGPDRTINEPAEIAAAATALDAVSGEPAFNTLAAGVRPSDYAAITEYPGFDDIPADVVPDDPGDGQAVPHGPVGDSPDPSWCAGSRFVTSRGSGRTAPHTRGVWKAGKGARVYKIRMYAYAYNCTGDESRVWFENIIDTSADAPAIKYQDQVIKGNNVRHSSGGMRTYPADTPPQETFTFDTMPTLTFANGGLRPKAGAIPNGPPPDWVGVGTTYKATFKWATS